MWPLVIFALALLQPCVVSTESVNKPKVDPQTHFKNAAELLASNKDSQAILELNLAIEQQPTFDPAIFLRAKTYLRLGSVEKAIIDAQKCKGQRGEDILKSANQLKRHIQQTEADAKAQRWSDCESEATLALAIASKSANLYRLRYRCSMAEGNIGPAMTDLLEIVQLDRGDSEAVSLLSKAEFLINNERDLALQMLRRCVSFDSEAKDCVTTSKMLRKLEKQLKKPASQINYREIVDTVHSEAAKLGFSKELADDSKLLDDLRHQRCEAYAEEENWEKAARVCAQVRDTDPQFVPAVIVQAHVEMEAGHLQEALRLVSHHLRNGVQDQRLIGLYNVIQNKIHQQHQQRSRGGPGVTPDKDYYKILGVEKTADKKALKKAYRSLVKIYHPDKYRGKELSEDQVMAKMQDINEAYEVLSDDERRKDYDVGSQDPGPGGFRGNPFQGARRGGQHPFGGFGGGNVRFHRGPGGKNQDPFEILRRQGFHFQM